MLNNSPSFFLLGVILLGLVSFQVAERPYRFPLDIHRSLSGTFGELRSSHFHTGLDIKVGGRVGDPVYAIADGYVYRLNASPNGYGNALYLKHPDGNFSVYGHLYKFADTLQAYMRDIQYHFEKYPQEVYPEKEVFPVKRGQIIGYAGNSGRSFGPHLHFEIRDSLENILDPLPYYPGEIKDNIPPILRTVGFEPLSSSSRVRGEFRKLTLTPAGSSGNYAISPIINIEGPVGIEYHGHDKKDAAYNHCGINFAQLYLDDSLIYDLRIDTFSFDDRRYIHQHIDESYYQAFDKRLQKAYIDEGNEFVAIHEHKNRGIISLDDNKIHTYTLKLRDGAQNETILTGRIRQTATASSLPTSLPTKRKASITYEVKRNVLKLTATNPSQSYLEGLSTSLINGNTQSWFPAYMKGNRLVYLWPLSQGDYPTQVAFPDGNEALLFHFSDDIHPEVNNFVRKGDVHLFFPQKSVFSCTSIDIEVLPATPVSMGPVYQIGRKGVPLFRQYTMSLPIQKGMDSEKLLIAEWDEEEKEWYGMESSTGEENNLIATTRSMGRFTIMKDDQPPRLIPLNFREGRVVPRSAPTLRFKVDENLSGIDYGNVRGTIDGKWVLFIWDPRYDTLYFPLENRPAKGIHILKVSVPDGMGNIGTASYQLSFN
ncbi:MAG: M23 family metallopeptidase [Bacteroidota bacterium]